MGLGIVESGQAWADSTPFPHPFPTHASTYHRKENVHGQAASSAESDEDSEQEENLDDIEQIVEGDHSFTALQNLLVEMVRTAHCHCHPPAPLDSAHGTISNNAGPGAGTASG